MTLSDARRVIAAAEKKAAEIKQPMNIGWRTKAAIWFRTYGWTEHRLAASIFHRRKRIRRVRSISPPRTSQLTASPVESFLGFTLPTAGRS
jgi:hypothetical protein